MSGNGNERKWKVPEMSGNEKFQKWTEMKLSKILCSEKERKWNYQKYYAPVMSGNEIVKNIILGKWTEMKFHDIFYLIKCINYNEIKISISI